MSSFEHRGVVEGFYGPRYSRAERLALVQRIGGWGMNRYVYAPKDDPLHRSEWRTPYPPDERRHFGDLVERGGRAGVQVGFAVSPGLTIEYGRARDVSDLVAKFADFAELGAGFFALTLDDVPTHLVHPGDRQAFGSLAAAHVALAHAVAEALGPDATLWLVPTDYVATEPTAYLEELGAKLDPRLEVGWTGRTVVSPSVRAAEASQRAATLRRRLLLWDNTPVSDGPMRNLLHLGPYVGRDRDLGEHVSGILLNPMQHPRASGVTLRCAGEYLRDPHGYDPEAAWWGAVEELGAGAPEAFGRFARAHRFSALTPDDRDGELEGAWRTLRGQLESGAPVERSLGALRSLLEDRATAGAALRAGLEDRALLEEIEPWLCSHEIETRRMLAAVSALEPRRAGAPRRHQALGLLGMEARLTLATPAGPVSYGPRRAFYPQLVCMHDDGAGFGADPVLFRHRCLADEVVEWVESHVLAALGGR